MVNTIGDDEKQHIAVDKRLFRETRLDDRLVVIPYCPPSSSGSTSTGNG
jgi:hypothetical protein